MNTVTDSHLCPWVSVSDGHRLRLAKPPARSRMAKAGAVGRARRGVARPRDVARGLVGRSARVGGRVTSGAGSSGAGSSDSSDTAWVPWSTARAPSCGARCHAARFVACARGLVGRVVHVARSCDVRRELIGRGLVGLAGRGARAAQPQLVGRGLVGLVGRGARIARMHDIRRGLAGCGLVGRGLVGSSGKTHAPSSTNAVTQRAPSRSARRHACAKACRASSAQTRA